MTHITSELLEKLLNEQTVTNFKLNKEFFEQKFETLAVSIAKEFTSLELQISRLTHKTDDLENRICGYEQGTTSRLQEIKELLNTIQKHIAEVSKQSLEDTYIEAKDIAKLQKRVSKLEHRVNKLVPKQSAKV